MPTYPKVTSENSLVRQSGSSMFYLILLLIVALGGYFIWLGLQTAKELATRQTGQSPTIAEDIPPVIASEYRNSIGMDFALIPSGEFAMGSNQDGTERPVHQVVITRPYYLGKYEVTQAQWTAIMGTTIQQQRDSLNPQWPAENVGPNYPMYYVKWEDAVEFVDRLNGFEDTDVYRLPTESEWEYACKGNVPGADIGEMERVAWFGENAGERSHPVGEKEPNSFGLYDMHGNLAEWCQDWYGKYPDGTSTDPTGLPAGTVKVVRGGNWFLSREDCRSASRMSAYPHRGNSSVGFRLVRMVP